MTTEVIRPSGHEGHHATQYFLRLQRGNPWNFPQHSRCKTCTQSYMLFNGHLPRKKGKRSCIAVNGTPSHSYGVSLAIWDHTVLPATRHKRTHPTFTPARQAGTRFTDHLRVEGWVSPGPGCKEQLAHCCYATARSQQGLNPWPYSC